AITPFLVAALWLVNRRTDPKRLDEHDALLPRPVRVVLVITGIMLLAICAAMFIWPATVAGVWPWQLTPLTARTVAGFIELPGVFWLVMATDGRWSAGRIAVETVGFGVVLLLIAVFRARTDFDGANPLTWVYTGGLVATLVALVVLYAAMERLVRRSTSARLPQPPTMNRIAM